MSNTQTKEEYVVEQNKELLAQTYHIDGRVTAIEGRMSQFGDQLNRIESSLLNKPPIWNIGNVMAIMAMVAALLVGISSYVELQKTNIMSNVNRNVEILDQISSRFETATEFQKAMHHEVGTLTTRSENLTSWTKRQEREQEAAIERLNHVETLAAENRVIMKVIGDIVKDIDLKGSRVWNTITEGGPTK